MCVHVYVCACVCVCVCVCVCMHVLFVLFECVCVLCMCTKHSLDENAFTISVYINCIHVTFPQRNLGIRYGDDVTVPHLLTYLLINVM